MNEGEGGFFFGKIKDGLDKANAEMGGLDALRSTVAEASEDLKRATDGQVVLVLYQSNVGDGVGSAFYGYISAEKNRAGSNSHRIVKVISIENQLFPLKLAAIGVDDNWVCSNIDEFKNSLAEIFSISRVALRLLHLKNIGADPDDDIPF